MALCSPRPSQRSTTATSAGCARCSPRTPTTERAARERAGGLLRAAVPAVVRGREPDPARGAAGEHRRDHAGAARRAAPRAATTRSASSSPARCRATRRAARPDRRAGGRAARTRTASIPRWRTARTTPQSGCWSAARALTLVAAACLGRPFDAAAATPEERQVALAGAALHGRADALRALIAAGVEINAFNPPGYHAHSTALHSAVDSGSADAVDVLIAAGADRTIKDTLFDGTRTTGSST